MEMASGQPVCLSLSFMRWRSECMVSFLSVTTVLRRFISIAEAASHSLRLGRSSEMLTGLPSEIGRGLFPAVQISDLIQNAHHNSRGADHRVMMGIDFEMVPARVDPGLIGERLKRTAIGLPAAIDISLHDVGGQRSVYLGGIRKAFQRMRCQATFQPCPLNGVVDAQDRPGWVDHGNQPTIPVSLGRIAQFPFGALDLIIEKRSAVDGNEGIQIDHSDDTLS